MKLQRTLTACLFLTLASVLPLAAADEKKLQSDAQNAVAAFKKSDPSLEKHFKSAAGYAVFPNVGKGGFIVGGAHGNGVLYEGGKAVGTTSLTQVSVGAQIGGQEFSEVIFFEDKKALDSFKDKEWAMAAGVGAVAAASGASANAKYNQGVMVFTLAKAGLMAEASIGGQKFKYEAFKK